MTAKLKRKYSRLSPATWAEIRALWETGEPTLEGLSARYGVTTRTLQSHFAKHGTVKGAEAAKMAAAVRDGVFASDLDDRDTRIQKGRETRWSALANAEKIEALIMAQLEQAQIDAAAAFKASAMIKVLSLAAQSLERTQAMKWKALGLDRVDETDELPQIDIRYQGDDEVRAMVAAQRTADSNVDSIWADTRSADSAPRPPSTEDDDIVVEGN
jgi:hypothetical protein